MSYYEWRALCVGGREAAAGRAEACQAQEAGTIRCTRDDRGPHDRQELLGQVVVHQPRTLQRLRDRLPRGRSYVRNGFVVDLQIAKGEITAMVSGSELYNVKITIAPVTAAALESHLSGLRRNDRFAG